MFRILSFLLLLSVLVSQCSSKGKSGLMPEVKTCDSAIVMYYHTPGNPRFFNITRVKDMALLEPVTDDVNRKVIPPKDSCTTQGKIYFYGKGGAVYPVYFSRNSDCLTLSFIKTGVKYYTRMGSASNNLLNQLEQQAEQLPGNRP